MFARSMYCFRGVKSVLIRNKRDRLSAHLFNELISFLALVGSAVLWKTEFVERERHLDVVDSKGSVVKAASTELLSDILYARRR